MLTVGEAPAAAAWEAAEAGLPLPVPEVPTHALPPPEGDAELAAALALSTTAASPEASSERDEEDAELAAALALSRECLAADAVQPMPDAVMAASPAAIPSRAELFHQMDEARCCC